MDRSTATLTNGSPAVDLFAEAAAQDKAVSSSKSSSGLGLFARRMSSIRSNETAASDPASTATSPPPTAASPIPFSDPASVDSPGSRLSTLSMLANAAATVKASLSRPGSAAGSDHAPKSPVPRKLNISSPVEGSFTSSSPMRETVDLPNMTTPVSASTPKETSISHTSSAPPPAGPMIITEETEDDVLTVDGDTFVLSPRSPTAPAPMGATATNGVNHQALRDPLFEKPAEAVPAASALSPATPSAFPGHLEVPADHTHVPLVGRGSLGKLSTPPVSSSAVFAANLRERASMTNLSVAAVENGSDGSLRSRLRTRSNEDLGSRSRRESGSTVKSISGTAARGADPLTPNRHVPHQASIDTTAGMSVASTSALHSGGLVGSTGSNTTSMTTIPTSVSQPLSELDETATLATQDTDLGPSDLSDPRAPPPGSYAIHPPTMLQLFEASQCILYDENGIKLRFGDIFKRQKTLVCFLRHWWCGFCQEFALSLQEIDPEPLERAGLGLVVIGQGDWHVTKAYKSVMQVPFPMYADPSRQVYKALGMTLRTNDAGPACAKPDYAKSGMTKAIVVAIKKGLFDMPLRAPGDMKLLGGEFILGPGLQCSFVHRMVTTRGHLDVPRVLTQAGIDLTLKAPAFSDIPIPPIPESADVNKDLPARPHSVNSMARTKRFRKSAKNLLRRGSNIDTSNDSSMTPDRPRSRILGRNHSSATLDADSKPQSRSLGAAMGRQFGSSSKVAAEQEGGRKTPTQDTVFRKWGTDGDSKYARAKVLDPAAPRPVSKDGPQNKKGVNGDSSPRIKEPVSRITSFAQRDIMQAALQPMSRDVTPNGSAGTSLKASTDTTSPKPNEDGKALSPTIGITESPAIPSSSGPSSHRVSPVSASASMTFGQDRSGFSNSSASLSRIADIKSNASANELSESGSRISLVGQASVSDTSDGGFLRPARANGLGRIRTDSSDTFDAVRDKGGEDRRVTSNGNAHAAGAVGGSFLDDLNEMDGLVIRTPSPDRMRRMHSPYVEGTDEFISEEDEEEDEYGAIDEEEEDVGQRRQERDQQTSHEAASVGLNIREVEPYGSDSESDDSDVLGSRASSRANRITPDPSMTVNSPLTADSLRSGAGWYSGRRVSEHIIEEEEDEDEEYDQPRRSSEPEMRGGLGAVKTHSRGSSYEREHFSANVRRGSTGMDSISSAGTAERIRRNQVGVGSVYQMESARGQLQSGASSAFEDDEISESTEGGLNSRRGSAATAELPFDVSEDETRESLDRSPPASGASSDSFSPSPTSSPGSPSGSSYGRRNRAALPPQQPQPSQPLPPLRVPHRLGPLASAGQRAQLSAFNEEEEEELPGRSSVGSTGASLVSTEGETEEDEDDDDGDDEVRFVDSPEHPQPRLVEDEEEDDARTETQHGRSLVSPTEAIHSSADTAQQRLAAAQKGAARNLANPHAELERIQAERRREQERLAQRRRRMARRGLDSDDEDEDSDEDEDEDEEEEEEEEEADVTDRSNEAPWA